MCFVLPFVNLPQLTSTQWLHKSISHSKWILSAPKNHLEILKSIIYRFGVPIRISLQVLGCKRIYSLNEAMCSTSYNEKWCWWRLIRNEEILDLVITNRYKLKICWQTKKVLNLTTYNHIIAIHETILGQEVLVKKNYSFHV